MNKAKKSNKSPGPVNKYELLLAELLAGAHACLYEKVRGSWVDMEEIRPQVCLLSANLVSRGTTVAEIDDATNNEAMNRWAGWQLGISAASVDDIVSGFDDIHHQFLAPNEEWEDEECESPHSNAMWTVGFAAGQALFDE